MANEINVSEIEVSSSGLISARVRYENVDDQIWFQLPIAHRPHMDLIAGAIASTFGGKFDRWVYSGPLSSTAQQRLALATTATWEVPPSSLEPYQGGDRTILNFSGGFDSLAALALSGSETSLVSLDFGSRFGRERRFYEKFDTAIVETNARKFESSWTFMGAGSLLLSDFFNAGFISFGSILEASPWGFVRRGTSPNGNAIFGSVGLTEFRPVAGLTEFGTAKIALDVYPNEITNSLTSLADVHTEKYLRKNLILKALLRGNSMDRFSNVDPPTLKAPIKFGDYLAADFLAPGVWLLCPVDSDEWMKQPVSALVEK